MDVSIVELASIRPYERNPRLNDAAVDAVARSLQEFGFRQPIVVDAEGVIVCGHTRWKAATKLGLARVILPGRGFSIRGGYARGWFTSGDAALRLQFSRRCPLGRGAS